jgi:hydrogenase/urease accessory protein HupE
LPICLLLSLTLAQPVAAHDPGLSTATLECKPDHLEIALVFSIADAGQIVNAVRNEPPKFSREDLARDAKALPEIATEAFAVRFDDQPAKASHAQCRFDDRANVSVSLRFDHAGRSNLWVQSKWLALLPPGHRQFVSVRDADGRILKEEMLSANADSIAWSLHETSAPAGDTGPQSFAGFAALGVKHIWTGYDHLLFLFGLLIVTQRFASSLKVITCFTLAHSITLAIATFSRIEFPARIVEPLIAASIVYVGVENLLRRGDPSRRGLLTFGFGLVHGLGFASVLKEMGVGARPGGVALPLFSFNLGVELGQVAVAAAVLPLLWKLKTNPAFAARWAPACSALVALLGSYWLVQRLWE